MPGVVIGAHKIIMEFKEKIYHYSAQIQTKGTKLDSTLLNVIKQ
jgi:hypothetical protein